VAKEEAVDRGDVVVVLVLRRLLRLRLQEEQPVEADAVLVLGDKGQEARQLLFLPSQVGIQQGLVALAPAPQHVVGAAQPVRRLEHGLDLRSGEGEDLRVGVGRGAGGVPWVSEQVRGAPQQAQAGALHVLLDGGADRIEVGAALGEGTPVGRHVAIVEGEEGHAERGEELEGGVDLGAGRLHRIAPRRQPWTIEGADAEDVRARPVEGVPQADGDPEVLLHSLSEDEPIRLVHLVGERLARLEPAERNPLWNVREEACHAGPPRLPSRRCAVTRDGTRLVCR
jgi:hypothetical protein